MARRSKYTPERVERIVQAIATDGGDESGWVAGGISEATFYSWLKQHPEFLELVERAREDFRKNAPPRQRKLAKERLTEVLEKGQVISWKTTKHRRLEHFTPTRNKSEASGREEGSQGDKLLWYQKETIEATHEENRGVPQWAIDRILPKAPPDIESAIALLEQHGYIVTLPTDQLAELVAQANVAAGQGDSSNGKLGLTEEAANAIRARILGLPEDAPDSHALPDAVGDRPQSG